MQPGRQVQDEQDQSCHDKGVAASGDRVGQLVAELDPVVVDPASANHGDAVQVRDVVGSKEGSEDVAHETADAVHGKDVESVVDLKQELELGAVVGKGCAENAERNGCPDRDVSCATLASYEAVREWSA